MEKNYNGYQNLGYWFLSLIVLVVAGFYVTYFSVIFQPQASIIHIHFALMSLWIVMLIAQPFLIKYKKLAIHRLLGKISYVLVPLVLTSGFLMIRYSYYNFIDHLQQQTAQGQNQFSNDQVLEQAAVYTAIAFLYLMWFLFFYCLAVYNRRKTPVHSRFMLATALTLLGPTVDRIMFFVFKLEKLFGLIPIETLSFFIADLVLTILLLKDYRNKRPTKTIWTCLLIYIIGQVLYFTIPKTGLWVSFVTFIMKPVP